MDPTTTVADAVKSLGHSFHLVELEGAKNSDIYATLYWGNSKGEGKCTESFLLPWNDETKLWRNDAAYVWVRPDGKWGHGRLYENGNVYGLYCSPIEADVKLFITAYVTGLAYVLEPKDQSNKELLWATVAGIRDGRPFVSETIPLSKVDDEYRCPNDSHGLTAKGYGVQHVKHPDTGTEDVLFTTFDRPEALHFFAGVQAGFKIAQCYLLSSPKDGVE